MKTHYGKRVPNCVKNENVLGDVINKVKKDFKKRNTLFAKGGVKVEPKVTPKQKPIPSVKKESFNQVKANKAIKDTKTTANKMAKINKTVTKAFAPFNMGGAT